MSIFGVAKGQYNAMISGQSNAMTVVVCLTNIANVITFLITVWISALIAVIFIPTPNTLFIFTNKITITIVVTSTIISKIGLTTGFAWCTCS